MPPAASRWNRPTDLVIDLPTDRSAVRCGQAATARPGVTEAGRQPEANRERSALPTALASADRESTVDLRGELVADAPPPCHKVRQCASRRQASSPSRGRCAAVVAGRAWASGDRKTAPAASGRALPAARRRSVVPQPTRNPSQPRRDRLSTAARFRRWAPTSRCCAALRPTPAAVRHPAEPPCIASGAGPR